MDKLKKINVAFPTSLTEQQKIVDYLDGKFTSIDNIEKEVEEYGKKLDDLEKGILKELLYNAKYQKIQLEDVIQLNYWKSISWKLSDDWNIPVYWSNWIYWYTKEESIVNKKEKLNFKFMIFIDFETPLPPQKKNKKNNKILEIFILK